MSDLVDYYYELAHKALAEVVPVPLAPESSTCISGEAQENNTELAGSAYLTDWGLDTRPSARLTDAELLDKMRWQLGALTVRERLLRAFEIPTVYPEAQ